MLGMLKAVFFDLGSTLWDDYPTELFAWEFLAQRFTAHGIPTTQDDLIRHSYSVIASYSPSLTRAMVWQRAQGDMDLYHRLMHELVAEIKRLFSDPAAFMRLNPLFPGVKEMLAELSQRYLLSTVSQHFSEVEDWMDYYGIRQYFSNLAISDRHRLYKPDPRLFQAACDATGVEPQAVLMVGDRLDNDIWPANRIGMTTVRVLADPYRIQQPRYHRDLPDYTIETVAELPGIIEQLAAAQS
jgi:HAD superfamily hydrolase (TIGR01549 family)